MGRSVTLLASFVIDALPLLGLWLRHDVEFRVDGFITERAHVLKHVLKDGVNNRILPLL